MYSCASCYKVVPKTSFSKTQLRIGSRRRCTTCIQKRKYKQTITKYGKSPTINFKGYNIPKKWKNTFYKWRNSIFGAVVFGLMLLLHYNYSVDSYSDNLFHDTCSTIICSAVYGLIENLIVLLILNIFYFIIFNNFWRLRYKYNECQYRFEYLKILDPYIISFPWLVSPILSFHSITSLIIDICLYYVSYTQQYESNNNEYESNINIRINYNMHKCNLCRTFFSFLLWFGLDCYLWTCSSLLFLFENGPNYALRSMIPLYKVSINNELLPYLLYINDLSELILSYLDMSINWELIKMKESIYNNLNKSNLNEPFLYLSIITAIISGYRLYMTPTIMVVLFPIMVVLGVIAVIIAIILLIAVVVGGGGAPDIDCNDCCKDDCCDGCCDNCCDDCCNGEQSGNGNNTVNDNSKCCEECPHCAQFWAFLGMAFAAILYGVFVWFIMKLKLNKLNKIQKECYRKHTRLKSKHGFDIECSI